MKNFVRKCILFVGLFLLCVTSSMAKVTWGVRAGGAYSALIQKVNDAYESGARFGFSVAALAEIPLQGRWSLRPELAFVNQGGNYYSAPEMAEMTFYNKCWYYSLQLPVHVAYTIPISDIGLTLYAGPLFDWSLFGKMKSREAHPSLQFGVSEEKDLKPCDLGVSVGLAVEYNRFFFSVGGVIGTIDRRAVKREGETSVYQNNVSFSLGYYFR